MTFFPFCTVASISAASLCSTEGATSLASTSEGDLDEAAEHVAGMKLTQLQDCVELAVEGPGEPPLPDLLPDWWRVPQGSKTGVQPIRSPVPPTVSPCHMPVLDPAAPFRPSSALSTVPPFSPTHCHRPTPSPVTASPAPNIASQAVTLTATPDQSTTAPNVQAQPEQ